MSREDSIQIDKFTRWAKPFHLKDAVHLVPCSSMGTRTVCIPRQTMGAGKTHKIMDVPLSCYGGEGNFLRTGECWHQRESPEILTFNLGQQFLDIIQIAALPQSHCVRFCFVATLLRGLFHLVQSGTKRFIDNRFKWCAQFGRKSACSLHYIVIYG